jgi:2-polyprenyl-3-methyl-5-hydroxy-6-metoxy-1,4-benzoquinol methylase
VNGPARPDDVPAYAPVLGAEGQRTTLPLPSAEALARFYADVYFQTVPTATFSLQYSEHELAYKRLRAGLMVSLARRAAPSPGALRLLDIGFGEGFELAAAQQAGFSCAGVDFGLDGLRRCHPQLEPLVRQGDPFAAIEEYAAAGRRFDVCVLKNVVEHVRDAHGCMAAVRRVLAPGGVAIITLPNDYSALQLELQRTGQVSAEYWFAPPQHLHYFNLDNFPVFASATGYEVLDVVGDFPIELFLLHPGSNYVRDPAAGPQAHQARMTVELLLARRGMDEFLAASRALARTGLSRTFTACCRPLRDAA